MAAVMKKESTIRYDKMKAGREAQGFTLIRGLWAYVEDVEAIKAHVAKLTNKSAKIRGVKA